MVKCRISLWIGVDEGECSKNSAESREPDDDDNLPNTLDENDERVDELIRIRRLNYYRLPINHRLLPIIYREDN